MTELMGRILDSEKQFIRIFNPLLSTQGDTLFFFPTEIAHSENNEDSDDGEEENQEVMAFLLNEDLSEQDSEGELILPQLFRSAEELNLSISQSVCPVCFSELGKTTVCPTCGTPYEREKLKLRLSVRPYCLGNTSIQSIHRWEKMELYKLLRSIKPTGFTRTEWNSGVIILYKRRSYIVMFDRQWYLFKHTLKLRQTSSHHELIKSLWKIWRKDVFKKE